NVFDPGSPASGAKVVFAAPAQAVQIVFTDVNGIAESHATPGTTVTVIQTASFQTVFSTFLGLQPGTMVIAGPRKALTQASSHQMTADMPAVADGRFYTVIPACPFDEMADLTIETRVELSARMPCSNATAATLVGRVYDSTNHNLLGVSIVDNADLT